jgi:hypothetical protein
MEGVAQSAPTPLPGVDDSTEEDAAPARVEPEQPVEQVEPPSAPPPQVQHEIIRVAVGLTPEAPGSRVELDIVDRLEASSSASTRPKTQVRRLRAGSAKPRTICREGQDDLVIAVGYLPDDARPVLIPHDCRLDRELSARSAQAAADSDLVGVLWAEHRELIARGAKERKRRVSPRLRNGLIIGGAAVVLAVAIGLLVGAALRDDTVVLKVGP